MAMLTVAALLDEREFIAPGAAAAAAPADASVTARAAARAAPPRPVEHGLTLLECQVTCTLSHSDSSRSCSPCIDMIARFAPTNCCAPVALI